MKASTWSGHRALKVNWEEEKISTLEVVYLLALLRPDDCMKNLEDLNDLVALMIALSTHELVLIHHPSRIGKSLKKKRNQKRQQL